MASEYLKWKYKDVKPDPKKEYTKKELRANWWDYNLKWVLLGVAAAIALGFLIRDIFFRTEPDYEVAIIARAIPPEETRDALKARLEEMGEDLNGDGKVVADVLVYEMGFDEEDYIDVEMAQAAVTRLTVDLSSGNVYLILSDDPEGFQRRFGALAYLDGTVADTDADGYEAENWRDMCYCWEDCPVLREMDLGTYSVFMDLDERQIDGQTAMEGLYVCRRGIFSEGQREKYEDADGLWQELVAGAVKMEG